MYRPSDTKIKLKNSEILALCKILLDSRAFKKEEMTDMLERLIVCCLYIATLPDCLPNIPHGVNELRTMPWLYIVKFLISDQFLHQFLVAFGYTTDN